MGLGNNTAIDRIVNLFSNGFTQPNGSLNLARLAVLSTTAAAACRWYLLNRQLRHISSPGFRPPIAYRNAEKSATLPETPQRQAEQEVRGKLFATIMSWASGCVLLLGGYDYCYRVSTQAAEWLTNAFGIGHNQLITAACFSLLITIPDIALGVAQNYYQTESISIFRPLTIKKHLAEKDNADAMWTRWTTWRNQTGVLLLYNLPFIAIDAMYRRWSQYLSNGMLVLWIIAISATCLLVEVIPFVPALLKLSAATCDLPSPLEKWSNSPWYTELAAGIDQLLDLHGYTQGRKPKLLVRLWKEEDAKGKTMKEEACSRFRTPCLTRKNGQWRLELLQCQLESMSVAYNLALIDSALASPCTEYTTCRILVETQLLLILALLSLGAVYEWYRLDPPMLLSVFPSLSGSITTYIPFYACFVTTNSLLSIIELISTPLLIRYGRRVDLDRRDVDSDRLRRLDPKVAQGYKEAYLFSELDSNQRSSEIDVGSTDPVYRFFLRSGRTSTDKLVELEERCDV